MSIHMTSWSSKQQKKPQKQKYYVETALSGTMQELDNIHVYKIVLRLLNSCGIPDLNK